MGGERYKVNTLRTSTPPTLMGANPLQGPLEGVGLENRDFLGPEMATSEASAI